jgi:hypothetical protein
MTEKLTVPTCRAVRVPCPSILSGREMVSRYDWSSRFPRCLFHIHMESGLSAVQLTLFIAMTLQNTAISKKNYFKLN